jgi:hypothetical protein
MNCCETAGTFPGLNWMRWMIIRLCFRLTWWAV